MAIAVWSFNTPQGTYRDTRDLKARFFDDRHAGAWRRDTPQNFTYVDTKAHRYIPWAQIAAAIRRLQEKEGE